MIAHGTVYLRPAERADLPLFVSWFNDWGTSRTLGLVSPISLPMEEQWFERAIANQGKDGYHFTACLVSDDRPIGTIGLFDLDLRNGNAGLGISIGRAEDRGKGYGTDMLRAVLDFGFGQLRLERIWLEVYDYNEGARRLYERVGFKLEGTKRHAIWREGAFRDDHLMAMLAEEWRALDAGRSGAPDEA